MKVYILAAIVLVAAVAAEEKLLGADDVDKKQAEKQAEMQAGEGVVVPAASIRDIKKKAKEEKVQLKEMQNRIRTLKQQLDDKDALSKADKKKIRKEFVDLKASLKSKKGEIKDLKQEISELKTQKKASKESEQDAGKKGGRRSDVQGKKGRKGKKDMMMTGDEEKLINNAEPQAEETKLTKEQKRAQRKAQKDEKKAERKAKKASRKNKDDDEDEADKQEMKIRLRTGDIDSLLVSRRNKKAGRRSGHHSRVSCQTDADCLNGSQCLANRKGHKFCRGNGLDKPAGKKCRKSEQCARGLQCFVSNTTTGRRKVKGVCADPTTADLTSGHFLPFEPAN